MPMKESGKKCKCDSWPTAAMASSPEVDSDFEDWDNGIPTKYATPRLPPIPPGPHSAEDIVRFVSELMAMRAAVNPLPAPPTFPRPDRGCGARPTGQPPLHHDDYESDEWDFGSDGPSSSSQDKASEAGSSELLRDPSPEDFGKENRFLSPIWLRETQAGSWAAKLYPSDRGGERRAYKGLVWVRYTVKPKPNRGGIRLHSSTRVHSWTPALLFWHRSIISGLNVWRKSGPITKTGKNGQQFARCYRNALPLWWTPTWLRCA